MKIPGILKLIVDNKFTQSWFSINRIIKTLIVFNFTIIYLEKF